MPEEKNKGGRPRKHATNADRQRAYYERKKQRMKELEERLAKIEGKPKAKSTKKKINRKDIDATKASFPWKKGRTPLQSCAKTPTQREVPTHGSQN